MSEMPINTESAKRLKPFRNDFMDDPIWMTLSDKHARHDLPKWDEPTTLEGFNLWLDRLDLKAGDFMETGNYNNFQEFMELNPDWPLRAVVGLLLELKEYP